MYGYPIVSGLEIEEEVIVEEKLSPMNIYL
jgi:hypothetical protein